MWKKKNNQLETFSVAKWQTISDVKLFDNCDTYKLTLFPLSLTEGTNDLTNSRQNFPVRSAEKFGHGGKIRYPCNFHYLEGICALET